jgi:spore coat protein U-like protein
MTKTFIRAALASALLATAATPAFASEVQTNLAVTATITTNCAVSSSPVAFTNTDITAGGFHDTGQGEVSVTCTVATPWSVSAGPGLGSGATSMLRKMSDGSGNLLKYVLFSNAGRTTIWGGQGVQFTSAIAGEGTGSAQLLPIYGRIAGAQDALPAGDYADTVAVTVTY